jgi:hypothetical protein
MAHAMAWRGVAWLYHGGHNPRFKIAQKQNAFITESDTSFSPRLNSSHSGLGSFPSHGISQGIPHSLSSIPPISGKSHKHSSPPTPSSTNHSLPPSTRPPFPPQLFVSSRNTFLMGLSPRSAKLQVTSLPHFPSPRSPSCLRLFLFVTKHPSL